MKKQANFRSDLRKTGSPTAAAAALARILGETTRGAAIFLLDQSAENLIPYGAYPVVDTAGLQIPFGRPDDPFTLCILDGTEIRADNLDIGLEAPSMVLLRTMYSRAFSHFVAWPLFGTDDKILGTAVILDPSENTENTASIVDFGAIMIEKLLEIGRHKYENLTTLEELKRVKKAAHKKGGLEKLIGQSPAIRRVRQLIETAAISRSAVLLTGETGTGKELAAEAIHSLGCGGPFIRINCAAIPENLMESELFGCLKGAFTGADRDREGHIAAADGGALLLDEIGEMPLPMQAKLLRLIQERRVCPVGGTESRAVDICFIAATNRDLEADVRAGKFRTDLYHRLAVLPIHLPPLRERCEDIPLLAAHFLAECGRKFERPGLSISQQALSYLYTCRFEGNVRELAAMMERAVLLSGPETSVIGPEVFTLDLTPRPLTEKMAIYERRLIEEALAAAGGKQAEAAEILGIPRRTLNHKVKRQLSDSPDEGAGNSVLQWVMWDKKPWN